MSASGTPKADQLTLGKLTVNWTKEPIQLTAVAAYTNSKAGTTHGWVADGGQVQWSKDTADALATLRECVERDLAGAHMHGVQSESSSVDGLQLGGGLGEHLGSAGDDVPPA